MPALTSSHMIYVCKGKRRKVRHMLNVVSVRVLDLIPYTFIEIESYCSELKMFQYFSLFFLCYRLDFSPFCRISFERFEFLQK